MLFQIGQLKELCTAAATNVCISVLNGGDIRAGFRVPWKHKKEQKYYVKYAVAGDLASPAYIPLLVFGEPI